MHRLLLSLAAVCAAICLAPATASAKSYDVPATMGDKLTALVEETPVAVLLPQTLALDYDGALYATNVVAGTKRWSLDLAADRECNGANACTLAWLSAEKGAKHSNQIKVKLAGGRTGWYRPLSCGGSCSPGSVEFTRGKVLYEIQARVAEKGKSAKALLIAAANSALTAGPR